MPYRTYSLQEDTIDWVDAFAEENDTDKSKVVDRALRVYAAKLARGDWQDPKFKDTLDRRFRKLQK